MAAIADFLGLRESKATFGIFILMVFVSPAEKEPVGTIASAR